MRCPFRGGSLSVERYSALVIHAPRRPTRLPPETRMFRAVVERDPSFDGLFVFAVRTTGVFCRPTCPSRKPNQNNVLWFARGEDAERAGFRACKRCRPLDEAGAHPDWAERLLREVEHRARTHGARLADDDLRAIGIAPVNARRYFKEKFGMTFQAYQRSLRLGFAQESIARGASASTVALDAGFGSESGFRDAFSRIFGAPPGQSRGIRTISATLVTTPIGTFVAAAQPGRICLFDFVERKAILAQTAALRRWFDDPIVPGTNAALEQLRSELDEYFAGTRKHFDVPVATEGTPFQREVWNALLTIPHGETRSYEDIARQIGRPNAQRAVGKANGDNRIAILIPCHRVIEKGGALRGYAGGLWRKQRLLELESTG
jgi:AraC family transcriptional regulator of adaptative response/methylated-DNA-[protein]-cysteine methyltransferase